MQWANLDMENDELVQKLQQKNENLKLLSSQVAKLEIELVQSKQQIGDAMNQIHELEMNQIDQNGNGERLHTYTSGLTPKNKKTKSFFDRKSGGGFFGSRDDAGNSQKANRSLEKNLDIAMSYEASGGQGNFGFNSRRSLNKKQTEQNATNSNKGSSPKF